jgi:phospholipase A1
VDGEKPAIVRTRDGGDGTVNLQGAMLESQQIRLTDKNHVSLIASDEARDALQDLFDAYGILLAPQATISLTPAEHLIESERPIEIQLVINGPSAAVHGRVFVERARILPNAHELKQSDFDGAKAEHARELHYDGPDLMTMSVKFDGVPGPAALRPVFETLENTPRRFVGPAFLVNSPG